MQKVMIFLVGILLVLVSLLFLTKCLPYYQPALKQSGLQVCERNSKDSILRVAFIGDSWAEGHIQYQTQLEKMLRYDTRQNVKVRTAGISGLTSKNIYYSIFKNDSVKSVVEWHPDYCIVAAGINDSDRKMGRNYYKENMKLIISLLLENQIIPVILEIPDYDIRNSFKMRTRYVKFVYVVSMALTLSGMDCRDDYRDVLSQLILEQHWQNELLYIGREKWNKEGYQDHRALYDEGRMHLNARGYEVLDSCLAKEIALHVKSEN